MVRKSVWLGSCLLGFFLQIAVADSDVLGGSGGGEYELSIEELIQAAQAVRAGEAPGDASKCDDREKHSDCSTAPNLVMDEPEVVIEPVPKKKQKLPELHHVVGVPLLKAMRPPLDRMPLGEKQELVCETCHGIEKIDEIPVEKVDKESVDFLKGAPYAVLTDFCYQCHNKKSYAQPNIHQMLDEQGKPKERQCKYCHEEVLKTDREYKPEKLKLRIPREKLCFGCHLQTPHLNAVQHQVKPSKEKLQQLQKSEKHLGIILPLSAEGKVMCVTCHSPHPPGVLDNRLKAAKQVENYVLKTGVSYAEHPWGEVFAKDKQGRLDELERQTGKLHSLNYQRIKTEVLLRLPAKDGSLCMACHTFNDRE